MDGKLFESIVQNLYANIHYVMLYLAVVTLSAFGAGHGIRWVVWNKQLDVRWPWFSATKAIGYIFSLAEKKWTQKLLCFLMPE